ncbi:T9SS type A sorting domain-containing protein [Dyadobacter subterraneus]|uniref:T9SS type A sorting domain-containing protein n=1 Tax=Dyadobacter subterraneus TaxID=2773304 RepID=A0ABR9W579_9BACT|nr:T9SS type A sorting domain-containing protein [Dyadobacter subterraneus]MBE9460578.1 T9SS type A sorting domain-containing protein [Dyadobacter subterraneus]
MRTLFKPYLFVALFALATSATISSAQTCATIQRFQTTTFARLVSGPGANVPMATYTQNGWVGSGSGNIDRGTDNVYFSDNNNTQTFTQAVTSVNLKGTGATFSMSFAAFNGNSLNFPYDGNQSDLRISYGGTLYAVISTSNGTATTGAGSISFFNGAVNASNSSAASYTYNITPNGSSKVDYTLEIKLPGNIPNSGNFDVSFVPSSNATDPQSFSDDFNVYTASLLSCPIVYSGTILNDVNGLSDNLVNGTAINTTVVSGLQVALYDGAGNIVSGTTTNVNADGTYNISYIETGTYTVHLLNLPPAYVSTGESSNGTGTTPDGTANGIVSSYTILNANTNTDKPNGNMGIEQSPQTAISSLAAQPNPGGTNTVTIPSTAFTTSTNGDPNTGDPAPGIVSFIKITSFPANVTSIVINGISYANLSAINSAYPGGIPTNASGTPTVTVRVDPVDGAVTVVLPIAAVDNAGVQDPTPGSITIPFSDALISVGGNIWNDANAGASKDGSELFTNAGGLFANLTNASGAVIASVPVNAVTGVYNFPNVPPNTVYSIILTKASQANNTILSASDLPAGWVNTGVNLNGTPNTANKTGIITLTTSNINVSTANFGIEQQPNSDPKTTVISQPILNQFLTLNGGTNPPVLSGSDPEDLPAGGVLTSKSVKITSVPANAELYYNNVLVTSGITIPNFDPSKLQVKFIPASLGSTSTQFQYAYVDAAGVVDPTPATYVLSWSKPLPVTLVSFDVKGFEAQVQLNWMTSAEMNSSYFGIERSTDARTWNEIGQLPAATNASALSKYNFTDTDPAAGTNYYRLKMTDLDESFAYSKIRSVSLEAVSIRMYPNPVAAQLNIDNIGFEKIQKIAVYNQSGVAVYTNEGMIKPSIDMANLTIGTYIVTITLKDGTRFSKTILKN